MKITSLYQDFLKSSGVCTDTRKIRKNCLFFALKGDHFNGNEFAQEALDKGAYKAVIDQIGYHKNTGETILYGDSLKLLQKLASYHRQQLGIPIIAITGSNGKTTTKELIHAVLAEKFNTTATKGNLNNHIGVPLTLLSMDKKTEIGIVEMGANHLKEIETLAAITQPDYGYITNFGKAHLEGFGSLEGVIRGKSELYKQLSKDQKVVFVNGNDPKQLELTARMNRVVFGNEEQEIYIKLNEASKELLVEFQKETIQTNLIGVYNFHNIAAAIAIGHFFKVPVKSIKQAIESYVPQMNRSQLVRRGKKEIILDAYNANPTSMMAALENFSRENTANRAIVIGDMFELGATAAEEHQAIVDFVEKSGFGTIYLVGSNFRNTRTNRKNARQFETYQELQSFVEKNPISESQILIKASRGMALERLLDLL